MKQSVSSRNVIVVILVFTLISFILGNIIGNILSKRWMDPGGEFVSVDIVLETYDSGEYIIYSVPQEKLKEFESGHRKCISEALKKGDFAPTVHFWKNTLLVIRTKSGVCNVYINWTDECVYFANGLKSEKYREVLKNVGFDGKRPELVLPEGMEPIEIPEGRIPTDEEMEPLEFKE